MEFSNTAESPSPPTDATAADNASTNMPPQQHAVSYMSNFENIIAPGRESSMTKPYRPQVANEFDQYLNPQTLKQHVLRSEKMHEIVAYYARAGNRPKRQIEREVRAIVDEIGLDRNLAIIRWCGMAITAIGKRILAGIYVNAASMAAVKQGIGRCPVLYLPSHRSYMDFILMSYICFHYEIEIPGIAAGMDFHSMFGMGTMLRKTGAFFLRRSFSNDELYWDVFREYMYALVSAYHIGVEFFIEGTRSRNFKSLVPKVGLLSMALLPFFTGAVSDITIVPVSISYERLLEEQLFVYELLGVPKPKESTKGFFKALKIIDEHFGKMYLDFGAPISVREFFAQCGERVQRSSVGAHLQRLNANEMELVKKLANEVIYQQQRRIVLSTFNLVSLFYASELYAQRPATNIDELARGVCQLKTIFEELGAHVATDVNRIKPEIITTVEIHANVVHFRNAQLQFTQVAAEQLAQRIDTKRLKAHDLAPSTMAVAVPTLALQLYINPCIFWLARPAYLILAALEVQQQQQQQKTAQLPLGYATVLQDLAARAEVLDDMFRHEFIIESNREAEELRTNLAFLEKHGVLSICHKTGQIVVHENDCSRVILSALAPFLCLYYQLAVTLNQFPIAAMFTSKEVVVRLQERVELLLQQSDVRHVHPYCLALDNLHIALYSFQQRGYIARDRETGMLQFASSAKSVQQLETQLLHYCRLMPFTQYHAAAASNQRTNRLRVSAKL